MKARLHLLPPVLLIAAALLRPSSEPVRAPHVKKAAAPSAVAIDPAPPPPRLPPPEENPVLHRDIDPGWSSPPESAVADSDDPDIQRILGKLETMIVDLRFKDATLEDILYFLRDFSGLDIVMDARDGSPVVPDPRISVRTRDLVLKDVLEFVLSLQGLKYRVTDEKVILVCRREDPPWEPTGIRAQK